MKYRVIIVNEDSEVIDASEEPVDLDYLVTEARDVAEAAVRIIGRTEK